MKLVNTIIKTSGLVCLLAMCSCDFLKETSQDEIIPSSLEDLTSTMYAEAYPYKLSTDVYLNLLTDDVKSNGLTNDHYTNQYKYGMGIFKFDPVMFDGGYAVVDDANSWKNYYEKIMGCNVTLDYLDKVTGSDDDKMAVKGQALLLRGYYYLRLALIYCQMYSAEGVDPNVALGVPLMLTMDVSDDLPVRATLKSTYAQIESDLTEAEALLKEYYSNNSVFRVSYLAADALLSRLYLYLGRDEDWQKVIDYADKVLAERPTLTSLSSFSSQFLQVGIWDTEVSVEPIWCYGLPSYNDENYFINELNLYWGDVPPYTISPKLLSLYDENDLRYDSYFFTEDMYGEVTTIGTAKVSSFYQTKYGDWGVRNAEMYLNRAEAYARLYKAGGNSEYCTNAIADLNYLRENRYAEGTYQEVSITDADELLDFCLQERRRELSMECSFRWFDIKRLNLSVTHTFEDVAGLSTDYTLESGDPLYALPIPNSVIDRNTNLEQNPR
ncbi:RagB/SusD family nutrient uptake outer membrane protein [Mangrovibacterium lignilyticum]|uniref:RagB/SusD family nutrient uptake outer membrane protein n=1 Tax=Mangrovibacterium lignilyticum TaxID=2668052 RepID=UPI0013D25252|nr:RagB/SusD family nutrient uptake outer membrane protein [Mangrovibacterium lignilyticum]